MPMTSEQTNAFKAGSGSLDVNILHLLCIGALLAFLFLWAAWALSDVWTGWSNTKVLRFMATSHLIKVALHRPVELTARGGHANGARYLGGTT